MNFVSTMLFLIASVNVNFVSSISLSLSITQPPESEFLLAHEKPDSKSTEIPKFLLAHESVNLSVPKIFEENSKNDEENEKQKFRNLSVSLLPSSTFGQYTGRSDRLLKEAEMLFFDGNKCTVYYGSADMDHMVTSGVYPRDNRFSKKSAQKDQWLEFSLSHFLEDNDRSKLNPFRLAESKREESYSRSRYNYLGERHWMPGPSAKDAEGLFGNEGMDQSMNQVYFTDQVYNHSTEEAKNILTNGETRETTDLGLLEKASKDSIANHETIHLGDITDVSVNFYRPTVLEKQTELFEAVGKAWKRSYDANGKTKGEIVNELVADCPYSALVGVKSKALDDIREKQAISQYVASLALPKESRFFKKQDKNTDDQKSYTIDIPGQNPFKVKQVEPIVETFKTDTNKEYGIVTGAHFVEQ